MPDLSEILMPRLLHQHLPGLDLGGELIAPDYAGGSIASLPATISHFLGVPPLGMGRLRDDILGPILKPEPAQKVLLILMDALSFLRFQRWLEAGGLQVWPRLFSGVDSQAGLLAPITTIVPGTTSAALTSLWTGRSTTEHGIAGYELWLKEFGVVANMIAHAPMTFHGCCSLDSLSCAGFNAETFLPWTTLGAHLAEQGVKIHAYQHRSIIDSGLSSMLFRSLDKHPVGNPSELWISLRQLWEAPQEGPLFTYVYWSEVDFLSHKYGPNDERIQSEFAAFSAAFESLFLNQLSPAARQGTLILMTADHGQTATRPDPHYNLANHPSLARRLHILPTGEHRFVYLFVRPGQMEAVREYVERTWPGQFVLLDPAYAVSQGLFGPGEPHPALYDRLGDLILLARGNAYLWWGSSEHQPIGRHGGLSAEEMIVPFLGAWV